MLTRKPAQIHESGLLLDYNCPCQAGDGGWVVGCGFAWTDSVGQASMSGDDVGGSVSGLGGRGGQRAVAQYCKGSLSDRPSMGDIASTDDGSSFEMGAGYPPS